MTYTATYPVVMSKEALDQRVVRYLPQHKMHPIVEADRADVDSMDEDSRCRQHE